MTEDTLGAGSLAKQAGTPFLCVINDIGQHDKALVDAARAGIAESKIPIADTEIRHRVSHIAAMTVGKSAAELNKGKDKAAADEIAALWEEVKSAAAKAIKDRAKRKKVANV
jgi:hypothetical protein